MVVGGVFGIEAPVTEEERDNEQEPQLTRRERRAQGKGGDSSGTVRDRNQRLRSEAAAQRKRQRAEERAAAMGEGLDASERVDDAIARSADAAGKFVRNNFAWMQWAIILGAGVGIATLVMRYRNTTLGEKHGHVLASVLDAEYGSIAAEEPVEPRDPRLVDPRTEFESAEAKAKAAHDAWAGLKKGQSPEVLAMAQLAAAHALYDQKKYAEARKGYQALVGDARAVSVKERAIEGVGFTWEAEGKLDEALAQFKKLSAVEQVPQKRLGRFHEARVLHLQGKDDEAKKLLSELNSKLSEGAPAEGPRDYLGAAVRDLLRIVDPEFAVTERQELEKKQAEEQAKRLQEMIEQMKKKNGNFSLPGLPGGGSPTIPSAPPSNEGATDSASSEESSPEADSESAETSLGAATPEGQPAEQTTAAPQAPSPPAQTSPAPVAPAKTPEKSSAPQPKATPKPASPAAPVAPAPAVPAPTPAPAAPAPAPSAPAGQ